MSEQAHETMEQAAQRLREDVASGNFNQEGTQSGDVGHGTPVPGTESTPSATPPPTPPAEAQKTETGSEGTSETVPYSRFKEVNDQLRDLKPFSEIAEVGYDADSVRRLVAFEQAYQEDPIGTVTSVVDGLDLPDAQKAAVKAALGQTAQPAPSEEEMTDEDPPGWAKPLIEDHNARQEADTNAYYDSLLQKAIDEWRRLDTEEGLTGDLATPSRTILRHIRGAIDEGGFNSVEELGKVAREGAMEFREHSLGTVRRQRGTGPLSVPGSGVGAGAEPVKFASIKQASKAAAEAWERGELPPITPEG